MNDNLFFFDIESFNLYGLRKHYKQACKIVLIIANYNIIHVLHFFIIVPVHQTNLARWNLWNPPHYCPLNTPRPLTKIGHLPLMRKREKSSMLWKIHY